jgi:signal transduction histidine kinase
VSETVRWLRRWVAAAAGALTLLTVLTAFAESMPATHHWYVPAAAAVIAGAWAVELSGVRWPRLAFVLAVVLPNVGLTLIGHVSANYLFLLLMAAWVAAVGTRAQGLAAVGLSLGTVGVAVGLNALAGPIAWSSWISWSVAVLIVWLMGRVLSRQDRLMDELRRLRGEAEQRSHELATLLAISRSVSSTLEMEPLMGTMLDELKTVVDYSAVSVRLLVDGDLVLFAYRGAETEAHWRRARAPLSDSPAVQEVVRRRAPLIVRDFRTDEPALLDAFRRRQAAALEPLWPQLRAWMGVPLVVRDSVIGAIVLSHGQPGAYTARHAELALTFAGHAALAIENARLYAQAQQTASLEERQKLARELHDSVSQALYGIALGARTARTLLDRDPARAIEPVDYVLQLAEAGIAEMRALIFELRPESLEQEGLVAALEKHAASLRARYQLEVEADLCGEPDVPLPAKEALYRIAQEALHNTVKHAQAQHVWLRLAAADGMVELEARDDGVGFDAGGSFPGHLGLTSMRERIARLGGSVAIDSAPGAGTRITARVPVTVPLAAPVAPPHAPVPA